MPDNQHCERLHGHSAKTDNDKHSLILSESATVRIIDGRFPN